MKKIAPLALFVVFTVFAQQQNTIPEPVVPLVPAQPIPEELVPTAPPPPPMPAPKDPKDTLPLPPLPPLPPMPLPEDTLSTPVTDSASVVPTPAPTPTPLPKDTTPVVPPKIDSASIAPTPAPVPKDTTPPPPQKPSLPMNTITVDLGPTIIGAGVDAAAKTLGKKLKNVDISALGYAAQYELQPIRFLSLPLRYAYMDFKTGVKEEKTITIDSIVDIPPMPPTTVEVESSLEAKLKAKLSISSIEAHPRLYPFGGSFFLEGMVGYSKLATDFSGEAIVNVRIKVKTPDLPDLPDLPDIPNIPGIDLPDIPKPGEDITKDTSYKVDIDTKASRDYLKYGGKLGWRVDFGKPGGFIFEHAIGWYLAKGLGKKTIVRQLADYVEKKAEDAMPDNAIMENAKAEVGKFDDAFSLLEKFIFIGGPRYTFAFGWRF